MKALTTLKSAISQSSSLGIIALLSLLPVFVPNIALGAELQTQGNQSQIFKINITDSSLLNPNPNNNQNPLQNSININDVQQADPLTVDLQAYLQDHNSPLQSYAAQLAQLPNWKTIVAISFVESNMCVHSYYYNCSGIGGQEYLRKYNNYGEWINDMSSILAQRYNGWTLDKMDGVYVQPYSANWKLGSKKVFNELTDLENTANQQRIAIAQNSVATSTNNLQLATIAQ
jgi:hypothetical protein